MQLCVSNVIAIGDWSLLLEWEMVAPSEAVLNRVAEAEGVEPSDVSLTELA